MKARIAHRIRGRARFKTPYSFTKNEYRGLSFYLQNLKGVNSCKISPLSGNIVLEYDERELPNICSFILNFNLNDLKDFENEDLYLPDEDGGIFEIIRDSFYGRLAFLLLLPLPVRNLITLGKSLKFIKRGLASLMAKDLSVEVLDGTAIAISLATNEFSTASSIMFLLNLGEKLEDWTFKKSKRDLAHSLELNVDKVFVLENGKKILKALKEVCEGDVVEVETGSVIPVDGEVLEGIGMVNQASFTGESLAVPKNPGKSVFAGTVLEEGNLHILTRKKYNESRINHIIDLIEDSEKNKALAQKQAESTADALVKFSFIGAGLAFLLTGSFIRAKAFLMVDYSCALKLTIPIAVMSGMSQASEYDILVKGGKFMENLAESDTIVFDKTGTLTKSQPKVEDIITFEGFDKNEALRIAACLEEHFPHSIANAVVEAAKEKDLVHEEMHTEPKYIVAHGISSSIDGKPALIGSYHFIFEDEKVPIDREKEKIINDLKKTHSLLYLAIDSKLIAVICIDDPLRDDAKETIAELRNLGFKKIVMLTGDAENSAAHVAKELNLDYYKSQVLPEDKASYIMDLKNKGHKIVMIGDGINDSVALSNAHVGISMQKGADIAKEISDITIGGDDLKSLVYLVRISRGLKERIKIDYRQIISFNSALILLGFLGILSNTSSAFLHNSSTVLSAMKNMQKYKI